MIVRKLRLQRGWSQEQLSEFSGLSVRTIQRIERGQKAGLESLKSLAAVFEVTLETLQKEPVMPDSSIISEDEKEAIQYVKDIKDSYTHLITYGIIITLLFFLNLYLTPHFWWFMFAAIGWGIGLVGHALSVFEVFSFFSPEWERKQVEKRLGRKL